MQTRTLGHPDFPVTEVGLGCWQLGSDWGDTLDADRAFAILATAVEQGIRFFDTADVYGGGRSERFIGQFLRQTHVHDIRVATKFGRDGAVYPNGYSVDNLRKGVEGSLERLGVDQLDLLQLHCIPTEVMREGAIFDGLRALQDEGLIKHFGASVETVEEGLLCIQQEGLLSLQVIYNIFRQKLRKELLPIAAEKGVGIIVRLPLASGLLTGKFDSSTTFPENDHRNYNRDGAAFNVGETFAGLPFDKGVALAEELRTRYVPNNLSMAQFALRWLLDQPAVSTIIPGASRPEQVVSNAQVAGLAPLPAELHQSLETFYRESVAGEIRGGY